ncbi:Catenin delta-2 [Operophtera brumata]|uniref:Catenin delta-2 n=1 Tax=Operophtera brumata TaxID=104452 RepID=A0A0L7KTK3_OPEBR|nr:Catenin delta-2 [Operophtera brumata]
MSSCEDLKHSIIDDAAQVIVNKALLHAVRAALSANAIGTKIVENCVCVLRNLSYSPLGKSEQDTPPLDATPTALGYTVPKGTEMLWSPEVNSLSSGLPILVELLRMEVDRVVCAVATALRNLAIDQRNKELIGKYAMRDLKSGEFSRSLLEAGGVERLLNLTKQRHRHTARVLKFAGAGSGAGAPHSPSNANSTLSRPMASTGGTRYEDRTIRRHRENDDMPAMDGNNYQDGLGMGNPNGRPMNLQGVQAQMPPPSSR